MIKYSGGKARIGGEIADTVKEIERNMGLCNTPYWEPFVGAGGIMMHMGSLDNRKSHSSSSYSSHSRGSRDSACRRNSISFSSSFRSKSRSSRRSRSCDDTKERKRYGSDANASMIAFMDAASNKKWLPPRNVSQSEFDKLKQSSKPSALKGFVGCALSFGSQFMSGYVGKYDKKKTVPEYIESSRKRIVKSAPYLKGVHYKVGGYDSFRIPRGMIIVCDPPYAASKEAKPNPLFREFDNDRFWEWVREASKDNLVFVCEEKAPSDFICVWQKDYTRVTNQKKHTKKYTNQGEKAPVVKTVEKLFVLRNPPSSHAFDKFRAPW